MRSTAIAAAALAAFTLASPALAHDEDSTYRPRRSAPGSDAGRYRTKQLFEVEFRVGPYLANVDKEFEGAATPFDDTFGDKKRYQFGVEADYQFYRIPWIGTLAAGFAWSFTRYSGFAPLESDPTVESQHPTALRIMPMGVLGVLRLDVLVQKWSIPIVPYVKGGLGMGHWRTTDAGSISVDENGVKGKGFEWGLQYHFGGMLWLNIFAPQLSLDMDNSTGVNNAYLYFEYMASDIDSFGNGMQIGTRGTWVTGVAFEF